MPSPLSRAQATVTLHRSNTTFPQHLHRARRILTALSLGLLGACGGDSSVDPVEVRNLNLVVEPIRLFLGEGQDGQLHARLEDDNGAPVAMRDLTWSSSDPAVATVDDDGTVSAIENGTVVITATANGKRNGAEVKVRGKGRLEIYLASGTGQAGPVYETLPQPLIVEIRDRTGEGVPGVDVDWRATGDDGTLSAGSTTTNQNGLTQVLWTLGTVAGSMGVQAQVPGAGTVDFVATAVAGSPEAVEVSPSNAVLDVGKRQQFQAAARDRHGNAVDDAEILWASTAGDVVYVDPDGVATAMSPGEAFVEAYAGSAQGAGVVEVTGEMVAPARVTDLSVRSTTASSVVLAFTEVDDGTGSPASYEVRYAGTASGARWDAAQPVDAGSCTAPVQGNGVGLGMVCATDGLQPQTSYDFQVVAFRGDPTAGTVYGDPSNTATASTNAEGADIASVTADAEEHTFTALDQSLQFSATARDASGSEVGNVELNWSTSDAAVADVNDMGLVLAKSVGVASIVVSAVCCQEADTIEITVTQVAASLEVSPAEFNLVPGGSVQLDAAVVDANGSPMPGQDISWASSDDAVATIDDTGVVSALSLGSASFQATYGSLSATAQGNVQEASSGSDTVFIDGFESGDMLTNTGGFDWGSNNRTSVVRDDGCAVYNNKPIMNCDQEFSDTWENGPASSGSHALRFRYPAGEAMAEQRLSIGSAHRELWASWWLRVPINFEHTSGNNKLFMFWMDDYSAGGDGSTVGMEMRPDGSGGSYFYGKVSSGRQTVLGGDQGAHPFITYPDDQGRWMQIVVRMKAESSEDAGDGILEVWRRWEGESTYVQTHDLSGQPIRVPASGPDGFSAGYLMGWANGAYSVNTEFLLDDFRLSSTSLLEGG